MAWIQTPVSHSLLDVFRALKTSLDEVFWLDSAGDATPDPPTAAQRSMLTLELGRVAELSACGELVLHREAVQNASAASVWERLDALVEDFRQRESDCPAGLVGWLGYACGFLPNHAESDDTAPTAAHPSDIPLMELFETRAALVESAGKVTLVTRGTSEEDAKTRADHWRARLDSAVKRTNVTPVEAPAPLEPVDMGVKADYVAGIARIQQSIAAGDLLQVCLTYPIRFRRPAAMDDWYIYLRGRSPANYCSFVRTAALECASTSPESLFEMEGRTIRARPMKGTRKRGSLPDAALAHELKHNPKDRAENAMIAELVLHDIAPICVEGSARVSAPFTVETYATVLQMTSTVEGTLREGVGPFVAFSALAPPASMTGAPREPAVALLDALEPSPRGLYSGAIAWIDGGTRAQFGVVIRALQAWGDHAAWHVGGGIIDASNADAEWAESRVKALAILPDAPASHAERSKEPVEI